MCEGVPVIHKPCHPGAGRGPFLKRTRGCPMGPGLRRDGKKFGGKCVMPAARHPMAPEIAELRLEEIALRYIGRFRDKVADWEAFEDAKIEGYRRAQHRFIGAGGSGKHDDPTVIPPRGFTLSIVFVPPGQGNAAHTHEVEEVFFVLQGYLTVFLEDETGRRVSRKLAPWECIACPPGVIRGFHNEGLEPVNMQVMLGRGRPEAMGYADDELYRRRAAHLRE